jgi:choline dehydrogenase
LLEAGPAQGPDLMSDPSGWFQLWGSEVDWADKTVAQRGSDGAVHAWPRGRVLGGSGGINGMVHLRGHQSSYDHWEALGAHGWNYRELLPFLRRIETAIGRDPDVRGVDGPMLITPQPDPDPLSAAWFGAAMEAGYPSTNDGNGAIVEGLSWTEQNVVDGRRQSSADAYLRPALDRPNLTVIADALVSKLVMDGRRCRGVVYTAGGQEQQVEAAAHDVVMCAGAVGTPQLLMLSGIGPAEHLRETGINVVADLPGVGSNLHDHPMCWVTYAAATPLGSTNCVPHVLFHSTDAGDPDLQIGFAPIVFGPRWTIREQTGFSVTFSLMTPASRGSVRLGGPLARDPLLIDPGYFVEDQDMDRMVEGLRRARQIGGADALSPWRGKALEPTFDSADEDACRSYIRATAGPYFHPVGTCRIGGDDLAVVDSHLRVRSIDGLHVADASVMPAIVSANTNATVLAIAEKAAALIRRGTD